MWTSGYYLVEAVLTSGPDAGRVATTFFIVHENQQPIGSRILVHVPVNTWEAYNRWGGKSLYDFYGPRAYRVSFDRPFGDMAQTPTVVGDPARALPRARGLRRLVSDRRRHRRRPRHRRRRRRVEQATARRQRDPAAAPRRAHTWR